MPAQLPPLLTLALLAASALAGCEGTPATEKLAPSPSSRARSQTRVGVELDERAVIVGEIVERLVGEDYLYLHLSAVHEDERSLRWIALELEGDPLPELGERIRVRSLAHRSRVWVPKLERDFESLDYVARIPGPRDTDHRS